MRYYANPCGSAVEDAIRAGLLALIDTPYQGSTRTTRRLRIDGVPWCADNGAFAARWTEDVWWRWLTAQTPYAATCDFAVAPDVVGAAAATLELAEDWCPRIRDLGYRVALVAQNGLEELPVPWGEFDVLFLGGSLECLPCMYVYDLPRKPKRNEPCPHCGRLLTEWKLGPHAATIAALAVLRGVPVHCGRVNSRKRLAYARTIGCSSADGTFLTFGPDKNLPQLLGWLRDTEQGDLLRPVEC